MVIFVAVQFVTRNILLVRWVCTSLVSSNGREVFVDD